MWKKSIDAGELVSCQERYVVVSTHLVAGRTEIRVYSDGAPDASVSPTEANLEDVYFMRLGGLGPRES